MVTAALDSTQGDVQHYDVVVIGAGFSGLYMLHSLLQSNFSVRLLEGGAGVGGTWYWNRYPGARCDVPSIEYSYSFDPELEQEWNWSERYPAQAELRGYLEHVVDRYELAPHIQFETWVTAAEWDEDAAEWELTTHAGEHFRCRFMITAMGCLSVPKDPEVPGLDQFTGEVYHTGRWPEEGVDFTGKRVVVIGTGSSGIQVIPEIAKQADHLTVLQRTPAFTLPARNRPLTDDEVRDVKSRYREIRKAERESQGGYATFEFGEQSALDVSEDVRREKYEERWAEGGPAVLFAFNDVRRTIEANTTAADYVRSKIAEIVEDPDVAKRLQPWSYPIGVKRITIGTDYYETYNRGNVDLIDIGEEHTLQGIVENGVELDAGFLEADAVVLATGYDAMTGALAKLNPRGRGGRELRNAWEHGPATYLGLGIAGFPNLLTITGPGSPSVLTNMVVAIEQHVEWIIDCLEHLRDIDAITIEPLEHAQDAWVQHVWDVAQQTLYPRANSWYMGANVPGKPRVMMPYPGGLQLYVEKCETVVANGYEGFEIVTPEGVETHELEELPDEMREDEREAASTGVDVIAPG